MPITYTQIDTNTGVADNDGGSGATAGQQRARCGLAVTNAAGSTADLVTIAANGAGHYLYQMGTLAGDPSFTNWSPGGTATVELNVTTGDSQVSLERVWISRIGSNATNKGVLGTNDNAGAGLAWASDGGVFTTNVTVAATNADSGDKLYVVWIFDNGNMHSAQGIQITPSSNVIVPYTAPVAAADVDLDGRTTSLSTAQATLAQVEPATFNELTGRTLCHGLTWTSPADFVNREATTRTLNLSTARATLSQQVQVTGRTTSVSTSRATLSQQLNATGRTTSITTSRATLSQEAGAVFNELTGRVLAGRAGYYTDVNTFVNVELTGRTLCHGLTYSTPPVPAVTNDLESRTLGSATSRATLSQQIGLNSRVLAGASARASLSQVVPAPSFSELTGRTLCHGLTYTSAAPAPEVDVDLTGRTTSLAQTRATLSQVVPTANVDLTGRTLCHGLTYSSGAVVPTTELTGRTACFSYPGGTTPAEAVVYNNLTARTLQASTTRATVTVQIGLQSRTLCIPTSRATLSQTGAAAFAELTGRTLSGVNGSYTDPASFINVELTGRTSSTVTSRATLSQAAPAPTELTGRVLSSAFTRATLNQLEPTNDLTARLLTPSTSRATLSQVGGFVSVNLEGRLLCLSTAQAIPDFAPRDVDLDARILCLSGTRFIGLLEPPPKISGGQLRGTILNFLPIGETARPINPRGVTAGNLLVGESK